jgi:cold shock CspA family protein
MKTGIVSAFFGDRGYGFIKDSDTSKLEHWFFHIHNCRVEPRIGLRVQFSVGEGRKGLMAIDIELAAPTVLTREGGAQ